jgi:hypothetical protein
VKRRLAIVAATTAAAAAFVTAPADASVIPRGDTNGCVVIRPAHLAICLGRL